MTNPKSRSESRPIRLTQTEYNRLCNIENSANVIYDFLAGVGRPDWPAHKNDPDQIHSRTLYHHILLRTYLNRP
jgi:hypothetical protein